MGGMKLEKDKLKVVIFLSNIIVEGNIHVIQKSRLTDFLNSNQIKDFIPVTNATIEILATKEKINVEFIEINKKEIKALYQKNSEL